jgi:hypothetical protein
METLHKRHNPRPIRVPGVHDMRTDSTAIECNVHYPESPIAVLSKTSVIASDCEDLA